MNNREEKNPGAVVNNSGKKLNDTPSDEKSLERRLIESAQNEDRKAFGQLIRMHQKRLFRYLYGLLGSFDQTEDIVQETFIKAWKAMKRFNPEYAFYPWLATIARNTAYNLLRREEKKESLEKIREKGYDPVSTELGPMEKLLDTEGKKRFYKALKALPVKYRSVFVLRHFENKSYEEISSFLNVPPGTVDSRLYRARQMLMEALKDLL
ncbi:MAG: RNA polymerase sigma factor [Candidatus Zixiibacteriota bacterium]